MAQENGASMRSDGALKSADELPISFEQSQSAEEIIALDRSCGRIAVPGPFSQISLDKGEQMFDRFQWQAAKNYELRTADRLAVETATFVQLVSQNGISVLGQVENLSDGGIAVRADCDLPTNSDVYVKLAPDANRPPLSVLCVVRNRRGSIYGLEFLPRNGEEDLHLKLIRDYLWEFAGW
jgi:PilZ domain